TMESEKMDALEGKNLPAATLPATDGAEIKLGGLAGWNAFYFYPRTSPPDAPPIPGWDQIPGARGCTPQSCGFRDNHADLIAAGTSKVLGVSTQDTAYQSEVVQRLHLPFSLLSDPELMFHQELGLPIFEAGGLTLYARTTLITFGTEIRKVFRPIPDPASNAEAVLAFITAQQQQ
ncbi:MAG: peroxiredoxin, partial [Sulfitobacter sp.]